MSKLVGTTKSRLVPLLTSALLVLGCSSRDSDQTEIPGPVDSVGVDAGEIPGPDDQPDDGDDDAELPGEDDDPDAVPSDSDALFAFLKAGDYSGFVAEPAVHPSFGPHSDVRTFFNTALANSLAADTTPHPAGSASIKELYEDGELVGWAVMVKTEEGSSADSWYFYEVLSTESGDTPYADGNGLAGCAGCHSSGADYVVSKLP